MSMCTCDVLVACAPFLVENRPKKTALVAHDATRFLGVFERSLTVWVLKGLDSVVFIKSQVGEREHCQCNVVCAFRWKEVTVVFPTKFLNKWNPYFPVAFKFFELERVDDVAQIAGDQDFP